MLQLFSWLPLLQFDFRVRGREGTRSWTCVILIDIAEQVVWTFRETWVTPLTLSSAAPRSLSVQWAADFPLCLPACLCVSAEASSMLRNSPGCGGAAGDGTWTEGEFCSERQDCAESSRLVSECQRAARGQREGSMAPSSPAEKRCVSSQTNDSLCLRFHCLRTSDFLFHRFSMMLMWFISSQHAPVSLPGMKEQAKHPLSHWIKPHSGLIV